MLQTQRLRRQVPPFCEPAADAGWRDGGALAQAVASVFRGAATVRHDAAAPPARAFAFEVHIWRLRQPPALAAEAAAGSRAGVAGAGIGGGDEDEAVLVVPVLLALAAPTPAAEAANRRRFERWVDRLRADVLRTGRRWRRAQNAAEG